MRVAVRGLDSLRNFEPSAHSLQDRIRIVIPASNHDRDQSFAHDSLNNRKDPLVEFGAERPQFRNVLRIDGRKTRGSFSKLLGVHMPNTEDVVSAEKAVAMHVQKKLKKRLPGMVCAALSVVAHGADRLGNAQEDESCASSRIGRQILQVFAWSHKKNFLAEFVFALANSDLHWKVFFTVNDNEAHVLLNLFD